LLGSESQIVTTRTRQVIDFQTGKANTALFEYEQLEVGIQYDFDISDFFGVFADAWGGRDLGNFETRRLDHPLERSVSVVGEPNAKTLGGYGDPNWSGTFDLAGQQVSAIAFRL